MYKVTWADCEDLGTWSNARGVICPVYKKGDKLECSNHRGINLLNTAYKVFADILRQRLLVFWERSTGEYQGGFHNDRSATDQLFSFRQIMEKCREFNVALHHLFVFVKKLINLSRWHCHMWGPGSEFVTISLNLSKLRKDIGTIFRKLVSQLLGYADDLNLIGRNVDIVKENFTNIEKKGAEFVLKVSEKKTKYMTTSLSGNRPMSHTLEVNGQLWQ